MSPSPATAPSPSPSPSEIASPSTSPSNSPPSPALPASERQRLRQLRGELASAQKRAIAEDAGIERAAAGEAGELEDRSEDLEITENNRLLVDALALRLVSIDRELGELGERS